MYKHFFSNNLLLFLSFAGLYIFAYFAFFLKTINSKQVSIDLKRRRLNNAKALVFIALLITSLAVWSDRIYATTLSFAALAAGLAIASKELLLCMEGSIYRTSMVPYQVGDRIEIDSKRGDVIEIGFMGTKIMEVGPGELTHQFTGRTVSIPHSYLFNHTVKNETYFHDFVLHVFTVPVPRDAGWSTHRNILLDCANEHCSQFITEAKSHFERLARKRYLEVPILEPRINMKIEHKDSITLVVRVTVPTRIRGQIEQKILSGYLEKIYAT